MRKILVHIGRMKTGSTSIQNHLHINSHNLIDNGFCRPDSLGARRNIKFTIAAISGGESINPFVKKNGITSFIEMEENREKIIKDIASRSDDANIIVSDEMLSHLILEPHAFHNFKEFIRKTEFQPIIIVYLRPQVSHIVSTYWTHLQFGGKRSHPFEGENQFANLNYKKLVSQILRDFPDSIFRAFKKGTLVNDSAVDDFFQSVLNIRDYTVSIDTNKSADVAGLSALRFLNREYPNFFPNIRERQKFINFISNRTWTNKFSPHADDVNRVANVYRESNLEICRMLGWPDDTLDPNLEDYERKYKEADTKNFSNDLALKVIQDFLTNIGTKYPNMADSLSRQLNSSSRPF